MSIAGEIVIHEMQMSVRRFSVILKSSITTAHVKSACQGKLGTTTQNHNNNLRKMVDF